MSNEIEGMDWACRVHYQQNSPVYLLPVSKCDFGTGKSLSEALLFAEHGGEHIVYRNCF